MKKLFLFAFMLISMMLNAVNYDVKYEFVYYDYSASTNWDSEKLAELLLEEDAFTINLEALNQWKSVSAGTNVIFRWDGSKYFTLESIRYGKSQTKVTGQNSIAVQVTSENVNQQGQFEVRVFVKHKYLVPKTENTNTYCYQAYGSYTGENSDKSWGRPVLPMNDWWNNSYMGYPAESDWYVYYTSTAKSEGVFECWVPALWITASSNEASAKARLTTEQNAVNQSSIAYQIYQKFRSPSFKITAAEWEEFVKICGVSANPSNSFEGLLTMHPVFKAKPNFEVIAFALHGEIYCTYGGTLIDKNDSTWYYSVPPTGDKQIQLGIRNVEDGWEFDHWTFNGTTVSTATLKTFDLTGNAWITAEFVQSTPPVVTYYKVFVESAHGTVYDANGTSLETYMGDPCFYADGELKLNVKDIDDGWEFDHWELDGVSVGSNLPYSFTPSADYTVVTAVYKEKETPVTPPTPTVDYNESYVCDFTKKASAHTAYGDSWVYDTDWTVYGGANNNAAWAYVKMGGKNTTLANINPVYVVNKAGLEKEIKGVKVYYNSGSLSKTSMSINAWGVKVYSDLACTSLLYTIAGSEYEGQTDTISVLAEESNAWSAGYAIQVYWDLANTSSTNGIICVDKIAFLTEKGGGETAIEEIGQEPRAKGQKLIRNGQIFILRGEKIYTITGQEVR